MDSYLWSRFLYVNIILKKEKPYEHIWVFGGLLKSCFKLCQSPYNFVNVIITFGILNQTFSVFYQRMCE
jgi:hypothetical protein